MSQALRKLTGAISKSRTAVIFINQLREKIGVVFGNPETTPGGRALKFYSSVRIELRRVEQLKNSGTVIGNRVRAKIVKNKVAPPFRTAEFDIIFSGPQIGISREGDILDLGTDAEIVRKQGAFYSYSDHKMGQGREQAKEFLRTHPEIAIEIEELIRAKETVNTAAPADPVSVYAGGDDDEGEE
jgi:recombination protein RecA